MGLKEKVVSQLRHQINHDVYHSSNCDVDNWVHLIGHLPV